MEKLKVVPHQKINHMSCGQRSQVALGLLFAQDPELLILDDFSMGLDPGLSPSVRGILTGFCRRRG